MTKVDWGMISLNAACLVGTLVAPADAAAEIGRRIRAMMGEGR